MRPNASIDPPLLVGRALTAPQISFQFLAYRGGKPGTPEERGALLEEQGDSLES